MFSGSQASTQPGTMNLLIFYSNSNPTNFIDLTGGHPVNLWLSQKSSDLDYNHLMGLVEDHNNLHVMKKTTIFGELELHSQFSQPRGLLFDETFSLESVIVRAHGSPGMIGLDSRPGKGLSPEDFVGHLIRRIGEIDPLGVEQVKNITFFACRIGCAENNQPSFASRFLGEISRRTSIGEPSFLALEHVTSSPYQVALNSLLSTWHNMFIRFTTERKWNPSSANYTEETALGTMSTTSFLRGKGARAMRETHWQRNHYSTQESEEPTHREEINDSNPPLLVEDELL